MPEIFRAFGFSFMFFSREHEPIHVHVVGKDGMAKYVWDGNEFVFYEQHGIKAQDLKRIGMMIEENSDIIIRHWNKYFGQEADNEDYDLTSMLAMVSRIDAGKRSGKGRLYDECSRDTLAYA